MYAFLCVCYISTIMINKKNQVTSFPVQNPPSFPFPFTLWVWMHHACSCLRVFPTTVTYLSSLLHASLRLNVISSYWPFLAISSKLVPPDSVYLLSLSLIFLTFNTTDIFVWWASSQQYKFDEETLCLLYIPNT